MERFSKNMDYLVEAWRAFGSVGAMGNRPEGLLAGSKKEAKVAARLVHVKGVCEVGRMTAPHTNHLRELAGFFADSDICRESFSLLIHLATRLAAAGYAVEILEMVEGSPEADLLKPLGEGLRIHLGMEVEHEGAAYELAREIAGRIEENVAA